MIWTCILFSGNLGHIFGDIVRNDVAVMLRVKRPPKTEYTYDIVRTHSLMIFTDLIEQKIVGVTKSSLLRCFPFISKLKTFSTKKQRC